MSKENQNSSNEVDDGHDNIEQESSINVVEKLDRAGFRVAAGACKGFQNEEKADRDEFDGE